ncbi:hypothetical protein [Pedobacter gandavensis]|uniref:hypothetical protein n=1 Tax=Pedobacter gandavensis TaxID=2679963 RepID=UPI001F409614|nr:hypothetical protein [Pedobacter gandavensis]
MINQTSKQAQGCLPKVLAISSTFIPTDYNNSPEGFNKWTRHIKSQVHGNPVPPEKMIKYLKLFLNVRKGQN